MVQLFGSSEATEGVSVTYVSALPIYLFVAGKAAELITPETNVKASLVQIYPGYTKQDPNSKFKE